MADSNIDAFLELKSNGKTVAPGETQDAQFSRTKAIQILSFSTRFERSDYGSGDDEDDSDSLRDKSSQQVQINLQGSRQTGSGRGGASRPPLRVNVATKKRKKKIDSPFSFTISKYVDTASATLFQYHCQYRQRPTGSTPGGKPDTSAIIQQAKLTFRKAGGGPINFMYLYFEDLQVVEFSFKIDEAHPIEEISFRFGKCELSYDLQTSKGDRARNKSLVGWDFNMNEAWTHYLDDGSSSW